MLNRTNSLLRFSRLFLDKDIYLKIKSIKDTNEMDQALKYSLISYLEKEYKELERQIRVSEFRSKDTFFAKNKLLLVPSKIKNFQVDYDKGEFKKIVELIENVRRELIDSKVLS